MFLIVLTKNENIKCEIASDAKLCRVFDGVFCNTNISKIEGRVYCEDVDTLKGVNIPNLEEAPSGEYSVINFNKNEITIFTDPNGYRHIYYYSGVNLEVVSNDFSEIFDFLKSKKVNLSNAHETTLASMIMGVSFYPGTGVHEIKLLNTNEYASIDLEKAKVTIKNRNYVEFAESIFSKEIGRRELLNIVTSRLKDAAKYIIRENPTKEKIVEVTGGSDSRLVLGTLLACKFKDFKVYTFGNADSLDQRVSQQIQNLFALESIGYTNDLTKLHAAKQRWKITAGAFLPVDVSYRSAFKRNNYLAFAGTGGELARGYFTKQVYNKNYSTARDIKLVDNVSAFRMLLDNYSLRSLLTDEFKWLIATESANYYRDFPYASELHLLLDYAFFQSRLRWHFGKQTMMRDKLYIETPAIMNDFAYHSLIFATNHLERISDKNVYDILDILYKPLNYLPFTNPPKFCKNNDHLFFDLPKERTSRPKTNIGAIKEPDLDTESDRKEIVSLFYEFLDDDNYLKYIHKDRFINLLKSPKGSAYLDKFAPLLYWRHYVNS